MDPKIEVKGMQIEDIKDDSLLIIRVGSDDFPAKTEDIEHAVENMRALLESAGVGKKGIHALVTNHHFDVKLMAPNSREYKALEAIFINRQNDEND